MAPRVSFFLSTHIHPALKVTALNDKSPGRGKTSEMPVHPWAVHYLHRSADTCPW